MPLDQEQYAKITTLAMAGHTMKTMLIWYRQMFRYDVISGSSWLIKSLERSRLSTGALCGRDAESDSQIALF